jgi:hypothetical protein
MAALVAFVIGVPLAEQAEAADGGGIVWAAIDLAFSIADVAGDS